jgi:hypothetical protein
MEVKEAPKTSCSSKRKTNVLISFQRLDSILLSYLSCFTYHSYLVLERGELDPQGVPEEEHNFNPRSGDEACVLA